MPHRRHLRRMGEDGEESPTSSTFMRSAFYERTKPLLSKGQLPEEVQFADSPDSPQRDDLPFAAHARLSLANSIVTSSLKYSPTFRPVSTSPTSPSSVSWQPERLDYKETPRAGPSIKKAIERTAKNIIGPEYETTYKHVFNSKYQWPLTLVKPVAGGSIDRTLNSKVGKDKYGQYSVQEKSIMQGIENTNLTYSVMRSKNPLQPPPKIPVNLEFRNHDEPPLSMGREIATSPLKFSSMTAERSSPVRFKKLDSETKHIKDFYDVTTYGPRADMAYMVERSPICYSMFNQSRSHVGLQLRQEMSSARAHSVEPGQSERETQAHRRPHTSQERGSSRSEKRFPPDGHQDSIFKHSPCNNEVYKTDYYTIQESLKTSPIKYSVFNSSTVRSSTFDRAYAAPGRTTSSMHPSIIAERAAASGEQSSMTPDIYDQISSTDVGRKVTSAPSMGSTVPRFQPIASHDATETEEHMNRRQHLLEARINLLRDGRPGMSKKLKKILNL